jgi:hypothetical protein
MTPQTAALGAAPPLVLSDPAKAARDGAERPAGAQSHRPPLARRAERRSATARRALTYFPALSRASFSRACRS